MSVLSSPLSSLTTAQYDDSQFEDYSYSMNNEFEDGGNKADNNNKEVYVYLCFFKGLRNQEKLRFHTAHQLTIPETVNIYNLHNIQSSFPKHLLFRQRLFQMLARSRAASACL